MPPRKSHKVDIDVVPYLSIMAIVLKLICLILIIMVMRIAVNPDSLKILRYEQLYKVPERTDRAMHEPTYVDCHPDHVEIQPQGSIVALGDLRDPRGPFALLLRELELVKTRTNDLRYAILIVRPHSAPIFHYIRAQMLKRGINVGYDVLESDVVIDWKDAVSNLQLSEDDLKTLARRQAELDRLRDEREAAAAAEKGIAPKSGGK